MSEEAKKTGMADAGQAALAGKPSRDEVQDLRRERDEARQMLVALVKGLKRASFRHGTYIDGLGAAMVAVERWSRTHDR
ncbi:hypothetical protein SOCEGT47_049820 [Sorangium cellulosum]|jgi:hypothetical protein|uniref:Uncharacterized protein n=1 Tax=Sorangium cellulosum TaxID=56 RepID=A0A4P2Q4W1_SORCE|nr:hypothetical protein [Sorangium cellulosum]AUX24444.1 hypothetical protein SOCEGT47_049820 [Sorangium cellulosum]